MNLQKQKVWQSKKYRRFVASLDCCVNSCIENRETVVPHHTEGGGRRKRDDLTIPACKPHHDAYHDLSREGFEWTYGVVVKDAIATTQAAWIASGNKAEWLK